MTGCIANGRSHFWPKTEDIGRTELYGPGGTEASRRSPTLITADVQPDRKVSMFALLFAYQSRGIVGRCAISHPCPEVHKEIMNVTDWLSGARVILPTHCLRGNTPAIRHFHSGIQITPAGPIATCSGQDETRVARARNDEGGTRPQEQRTRPKFRAGRKSGVARLVSPKPVTR